MICESKKLWTSDKRNRSHQIKTDPVISKNKTDDVRVTYHRGAFVQQLLKRKIKNITFSECVFVDLSIQHAMRMRHIVICGLSGCTIIFTYSHKRHDFQKKKKLLNIKFLFHFSLELLSEPFLILRRIQRGVVKNVYWTLRCKIPVILVKF